MKSKIDTSPLSFLRFFSALIVVYVHYGIIDKVHLRAGSIIAFFYMLSGFVLFLSHEKKGAINLNQYFIKRLMSIAPFYYLAFILYLCILIYMDNISYFGLFVSFLGLQSWMPNFQHYMNPPSWFVSGLLFFYFIFPTVFYRITKAAPSPKKLITGSILFWLSTIIILNIIFNPSFYSGYFSEYRAFIDSFPLSHLCSFYMGICGAYYITNKDVHVFKGHSFKSALSTLLILGLFILTLIIHYQENIGRFMESWIPYEAGLYAPIMLLMILNFSKESNSITKIMSSKIFIFLGSISYALYILQAPIYHIYLKFIAMPLEMSQVEGFIIFLFPYIIIVSLLAVLESKTVKGIYKNYLNPESKRKIAQDPEYGNSAQVLEAKTGD